jgi:hypothetical protein
VFPSLALPLFLFRSSGTGSIAAALTPFHHLSIRIHAACEIAQATCKAFARQDVLRPAFG